jgi:hypothetical protein
VTNGNSSELLDTSNFGQTFNWAFGGVLEVYNIVQCGDYHPRGYNGGIGFYNQSVLNDKFVQIKPGMESNQSILWIDSTMQLWRISAAAGNSHLLIHFSIQVGHPGIRLRRVPRPPTGITQAFR